MKIVVAFLLSVCLGGVGYAQHAEPLLFREKTHDFGELSETGGNADYEFTFVIMQAGQYEYFRYRHPVDVLRPIGQKSQLK